MSLGKWLTPPVSRCAVALRRGGVRGRQQMLNVAEQFGEGSRGRGSVVIFLADCGFAGVSLLCVSGCIRASLLGNCCFQDLPLRRAPGLWCSYLGERFGQGWEREYFQKKGERETVFL